LPSTSKRKKKFNGEEIQRGHKVKSHCWPASPFFGGAGRTQRVPDSQCLGRSLHPAAIAVRLAAIAGSVGGPWNFGGETIGFGSGAQVYDLGGGSAIFVGGNASSALVWRHLLTAESGPDLLRHEQPSFLRLERLGLEAAGQLGRMPDSGGRYRFADERL
jgi:hypothetical protein